MNICIIFSVRLLRYVMRFDLEVISHQHIATVRVVFNTKQSHHKPVAIRLLCTLEYALQPNIVLILMHVSTFIVLVRLVFMSILSYGLLRLKPIQLWIFFFSNFIIAITQLHWHDLNMHYVVRYCVLFDSRRNFIFHRV